MSTIESSCYRNLTEFEQVRGDIVYWMSRDQRVEDNWALLLAIELAKQNQSKLTVVFTLVQEYLGATLRQYDFMLRGLQETAKNLEKYGINFQLLLGQSPSQMILDFVEREKTGVLVSDFSPIRVVKTWKTEVANSLDIPFFEVDAHNVIPVWQLSTKQEFAARTIRPKVYANLAKYLTEFPSIQSISEQKVSNQFNYQDILQKIQIDRTVLPVFSPISGESEANRQLHKFIQNNLQNYATDRNDPTLNGLSGLSAYLHFGQISAQRIALEICKCLQIKVEEIASLSKIKEELTDQKLLSGLAFLEELIVRRELSDNFCFYNENYDNIQGIAPWAYQTLDKHSTDTRQYLYSQEQLEKALTHDGLWNASQLEMVKTGKMHGFMRMYWAKKILEWTKTPAEAIKIGIYLNDKYELDGRDPNGFVGILWAMGGLHDRPWQEREIFGTIRYMNFNGCKSKFDVEKYIGRWCNTESQNLFSKSKNSVFINA